MQFSNNGHIICKPSHFNTKIGCLKTLRILPLRMGWKNLDFCVRENDVNVLWNLHMSRLALSKEKDLVHVCTL